MDEHSLEALRYPIGKFQFSAPISSEQVANWIDQLEHYPKQLEELVSSLSDQQLDTPYRPGGWTVRQLVHHISDSHHNSYTRFKWALTEDQPTIKPYEEKEWAKLHDSQMARLRMSLDHLRIVHTKLVYLLRGLNADELSRTFIHPDGNKVYTLTETLGHYVWHGQHHFTHIHSLCERKGWL